MASGFLKFKHILFFLLAAFSTSWFVQASEPDILIDYIVPQNTTVIGGNVYTFTGLRRIFEDPDPPNFKLTIVSMAEFPTLNGQSVSYVVVLQYRAGGVNPPHSHPRSAKLLFLVHGSLEVGFIDTTNKLYTQTLNQGDMFAIPKGLVHYNYNADPKNPAISIAVFGSANPGAVSIPATIFATGIDDAILAKSFKTEVATIQKIKAGLATKA